VRSTLRLLAIGWWFQLKMRSRSAFDGILGVVYPMFFATSVLLMYREGGSEEALINAAVGASMLGVWSAVATTAAISLQAERQLGTLELLIAAPTSFTLLLVPMTLAMATIGLYSLVATLLWGRFAFGIPISFDHPLTFVLAAVVTAVSVSLVGFLLAVCSVRYRSSWALGAGLEFPVWLICGFLVPLSLLPGWVHPIAWALPPTWGVAAVKGAAFGGSPWLDIVVCLALSIGYALVGTVVARRLVDSARANATLALT
jgi:ABC-2 type transport system permease protein